MVQIITFGDLVQVAFVAYFLGVLTTFGFILVADYLSSRPKK